MNRTNGLKFLIVAAMALAPVAWIGCEPAPIPVKQSSAPTENQRALPAGQKRAARGPTQEGQSAETPTSERSPQGAASGVRPAQQGRAQKYGSASAPTPLMPSRNLADLQSASAARGYLGLGTAATYAASAFDAAGVASTAQTNAEAYTAAQIAALGLGSASTKATSFFDVAGSAGTAQSTAEAFATAAIAALGLGSASTKATSFFDVAGSAGTAQSTAEAFATAAIAALGLGSASTQSSAAFDAAGAAATALTSAETAAAATYVPLSSANQPSGYLTLNGSGQAVGTIIQRNGTAAGLASVLLSQAQSAYATDTGQNVNGDGTALVSALAGWSGGTTTAGNVGQFSIINAKNIVGFPTASQATPGTGSVDLQGTRTSTWQTALSNYGLVTGYGNTTAGTGQGNSAVGFNCTAFASNSSGASTAFGSNVSTIGYSCFGLGANSTSTGSYATVIGAGGAPLGGTGTIGPVAAGAYSQAIGALSATGYDPLPITIASGVATVSGGNFVHQLTGGSSTHGNMVAHNLSGGSANTIFGVSQSNPTPTYNSGPNTTTVTITSGDRTAGYLNHAPLTGGPGYRATGINGGRGAAIGSLGNGFGALAYKQGQYAQANTSLGGTPGTSGNYPYTILNTVATGATIVNGPGLSQNTRTILYAQSTSSSAVIMTLDGLAAAYSAYELTNNTFNVQNNKTLDCTIKITGRSTAGASDGSFVRRALVKNIAGTTSLVGSTQTVGSDITDGGAGLWTIAVTADATNNCLQISVTGDTGGTGDTAAVNWIATVEANELVF
jgi:hypothetical protein